MLYFGLNKAEIIKLVKLTKKALNLENFSNIIYIESHVY